MSGLKTNRITARTCSGSSACDPRSNVNNSPASNQKDSYILNLFKNFQIIALPIFAHALFKSAFAKQVISPEASMPDNLNERKLLADAWMGTGRDMMFYKNPDLAASYFEKASRIFKELGMEALRHIAALNYSYALARLGHEKEAFNIMRAARAALNNLDDPQNPYLQAKKIIEEGAQKLRDGRQNEAMKDLKRGVQMSIDNYLPDLAAYGLKMLRDQLTGKSRKTERTQVLQEELRLWKILGNEIQIQKISNLLEANLNPAISENRARKVHKGGTFSVKIDATEKNSALSAHLTDLAKMACMGDRSSMTLFIDEAAKALGTSRIKIRVALKLGPESTIYQKLMGQMRITERLKIRLMERVKTLFDYRDGGWKGRRIRKLKDSIPGR